MKGFPQQELQQKDSTPEPEQLESNHLGTHLIDRVTNHDISLDNDQPQTLEVDRPEHTTGEKEVPMLPINFSFLTSTAAQNARSPQEV